jgi:hypothetical protein
MQNIQKLLGEVSKRLLAPTILKMVGVRGVGCPESNAKTALSPLLELQNNTTPHPHVQILQKCKKKILHRPGIEPGASRNQ